MANGSNKRVSMEKNESGADTGLIVLTWALNLLNIKVMPEDIRHRVGVEGKFTPAELVKTARHYGIKSGFEKLDYEKIFNLPLPIILLLDNGEFLLVAQKRENQLLVHNPKEKNAFLIDQDKLNTVWSSGKAILFAENGKKAADTSMLSMLKMFPDLLKEKPLIANGLVASLLLQIFALATPLFTLTIIDKVFKNSNIKTLDVLVLGLIILGVFEFTLGVLRKSLFSHLSNRMDADMTARFFSHLMRLPLTFFTGRPTGDTLSRVREIETIRQFLVSHSLLSIVDFPFVFVFLAVMYLFSPLLTLIAAIMMLLLLVIYAVISPLLRRRIQSNVSVSTDKQSFIMEAVNGVETVKALSLEPQIEREWENHVVDSIKAQRRIEDLNNVVSQMAGFISKLNIAIAYWIGAKLVLTGQMTAGQLIAFGMISGRAFAPTIRIAQTFSQIHQIKVSTKRVNELLSIPTETIAHTGAGKIANLKGAIRFEHVSFQYQPDLPKVLEDINMDITPGEVIGIAGISGAGKSTLVRLLQRLYVPQQGKIYVDGVNIMQVDPSWFRRRMSVVLQETALFDKSIRDNISIGNPLVRQEQIDAVARLSGADLFIKELPNGYDTPIGENGVMLSMGQRQRLAIARALINDPKVLIFDEATSSLDSESEFIIQRNMQQIVKGRTVILIAHRLSTLRFANRILVLEKGRIIESGTPQELLMKEGRFAQLYAMQQLRVKKNV